MADIKLVYFIPVEGRAQARFGSSQFIGCKIDRTTGNLKWDSKSPVPIGEAEHRKYLRDYGNAVRRGDLQAVKVEPAQGGGTRVTVLPGSPAPTRKNKLRAAGDSWVLGGVEKADPVPPKAVERETAAARK